MKHIGLKLVQMQREFGGSLLKGKRKAKRPLSTELPIHYILRGDYPKVFPPGNSVLEKALITLAHKYGIKIFHKSFNWNHFHSVIQIPSRENYIAFSKTWSAVVAQDFKNRCGKETPFKLRPYTRVANWGTDFDNLKGYQDKNNCEAWGISRAEFELIKLKLGGRPIR